MKHFFVVIGLILLIGSCNRPVSQVVAEQPKPKATLEPAHKKRDRTSDLSAPEKQIDEDVLAESSRISKRLRPDPTPAYTTDPTTGEKVPTLLVELKELGCLRDTCPQYTIRLLADYTLEYIGIANVDLLGEFTGKAKFNPLIKIGPLTSKGKFFRMNEVYPVGIKDYELSTLTTTTIYVDHRGRKNTVTEVSEAPEGFGELEKEILSWVNRVIWVPVE